jgi:hypothetical protein
LAAAAVFTLALDALSACQLEEMRRAYDPIRQSADAATTASQAALKQIEVANRQANVMQGQLSVMEGQESKQRPWVSFADPKILTDFTFDPKDAGRVTFGAVIQNTGHVPAENVRPFIKTYIHGRGGETGYPNEIRDKFCQEMAKEPLVATPLGRLQINGNVLFPGDKMPFEERIAIPPNTIDEIRSKHDTGSVLWVIVCINYKIILQENDRHQTSHIFMVRSADMVNGVPLNQDSIPKDKLNVSWTSFGTLAN